jgi:hypothetical protein
MEQFNSGPMTSAGEPEGWKNKMHCFESIAVFRLELMAAQLDPD